jgi:hypothetical protein
MLVPESCTGMYTVAFFPSTWCETKGYGTADYMEIATDFRDLFVEAFLVAEIKMMFEVPLSVCPLIEFVLIAIILGKLSPICVRGQL